MAGETFVDDAENRSWGFLCINVLHQIIFQEPKLEVPTIYKAYIRPM